jgi:AraC-like DNA-binding protein
LISLSRLKKAAELLAEGKYKINEVAYMVGYTVHANFSRDFNKQFGVTPSAYVNNMKPESMLAGSAIVNFSLFEYNAGPSLISRRIRYS